MGTSAALASPTAVEVFFKEYFGAWQGTDEGRILSYYTDNVVLQIPNTVMKGKRRIYFDVGTLQKQIGAT